MKKEVKKDWKYTVVKDGKREKIMKSGFIEVDFTLEELVGAINSYERGCKEMDAEIQVRQVLVKNFSKANPKFVKFITNDNIGIINEFAVAWIELEERKKKLEEYRQRIKDLEADIAEVEKQTGLKPKLATIKYGKESDKQDGK